MNSSSEATFSSIVRTVLRNSGLLQVRQSLYVEVEWISAHRSYDPVV
jgi:hypothetical protein